MSLIKELNKGIQQTIYGYLNKDNKIKLLKLSIGDLYFHSDFSIDTLNELTKGSEYSNYYHIDPDIFENIWLGGRYDYTACSQCNVVEFYENFNYCDCGNRLCDSCMIICPRCDNTICSECTKKVIHHNYGDHFHDCIICINNPDVIRCYICNNINCDYCPLLELCKSCDKIICKNCQCCSKN